MTAQKKNSPFAAILNFIGTAIIIIIIAFCLTLVAPKIFGISAYTVLTGSMEPAVPVGSVVYAKSVDPTSLAEGDIVVFYDGRNELPVTHRIVQNDPSEGQIITKGDANNAVALSPIQYGNIIGKVVLHVPFLGRLLIPFGTLLGKAAALCMLLAGFLLCEISRRLRN